jgi:1-acyl-sn-glycerol-3-phosphate acyltransferase
MFLFLSSYRDASRPAVNQALAQGDRIGIVPGGIAEIFQGYPQPSTHPDEEYAIVGKGLVRMAIQHNLPMIPVYCFGATKLLHRVQLPLLEQLSRWLRISICFFYGRYGLPIPFRQRLLYVIGAPIYPPSTTIGTENVQERVDRMHQDFCEELLRLFEQYKESYGWGYKTLKLVSS